jgi:hypothetical protein
MWENSKRNGRGILKSKNGYIYDGDYVDDIKEGQGRGVFFIN